MKKYSTFDPDSDDVVQTAHSVGSGADVVSSIIHGDLLYSERFVEVLQLLPCHGQLVPILSPFDGGSRTAIENKQRFSEILT